MAITIREQQDVGSQVATNTFTTGAGTAVGDLALAFVGNDYFATHAGVVVAPTGTCVTTWYRGNSFDIDWDNVSNKTHLRVYWGFVTSAGAKTIITTAGTAGEEMYHGIMILAGPNVVYDCAEGQVLAAASTSHLAPSLTPRYGRTDNLLICLWQAGSQTNATFTAVPGSMTGYTNRTVAGFTAYRMASEAWASSAATGTRSGTLSTSLAYPGGLSVLVGNNSADPARVSTSITVVGSTTWVTPSTPTTASPTYPASLAQGDVVYAILVSKPSAALWTVPANWEQIICRACGSGTASQGSGVGAVRVDVFKLVCGASPPSGSQAFTMALGSGVVSGTMIAYRASATTPNLTWDFERISQWDISTASTTIGGTGDTDLELAANDQLTIILAASNSTATTLTLTGLTETGATIGTLTRDPNATAVNATGNKTAATVYRAPVTAGPSTAKPVATATSNVSVTAAGVIFRTRATVDSGAAFVAGQPEIVPQAVMRAAYR